MGTIPPTGYRIVHLIVYGGPVDVNTDMVLPRAKVVSRISRLASFLMLHYFAEMRHRHRHCDSARRGHATWPYRYYYQLLRASSSLPGSTAV